MLSTGPCMSSYEPPWRSPREGPLSKCAGSELRACMCVTVAEPQASCCITAASGVTDYELCRMLSSKQRRARKRGGIIQIGLLFLCVRLRAGWRQMAKVHGIYSCPLHSFDDGGLMGRTRLVTKYLCGLRVRCTYTFFITTNKLDYSRTRLYFTR
jgi:hypothetical protein